MTTQTPQSFLSSFWHGQSISPSPVADRYLLPIQGRMMAESAVDDSDSEIERCLSPCVCGPLLVNVAKYLRDEGYTVNECEDGSTQTDSKGKTWTLSGDYRYSIKDTGFNSQRLGNCEVCHGRCDNVYIQSEQRQYVNGWTHHECKDTLFGHKECLESVRRIVYSPSSKG